MARSNEEPPGNAGHQPGSPEEQAGLVPGVAEEKAGLVPGVPGEKAGLVPGGPRGWYSRGYLPHRDHPGLLQSITYRLGDSLPASELRRIELELNVLPAEQHEPERRKRIEEWLDAGHGSCVLRHAPAANCVIDTWRHFAGERYDLIAWVVMPNHVHVLIRVYQGMSLSRIVGSWKSYTGRRIGAMAHGTPDAPGTPGTGPASSPGTPGTGPASSPETSASPPNHDAGVDSHRPQGVWMRDYWDRFIRNPRHFADTVDYIRQNPVKAGLVKRAEEWPFSSAAEANG